MSSRHSGPFCSFRSLCTLLVLYLTVFPRPLLQHDQSKVSDEADSTGAEEEKEESAQRENSLRLAEVGFRLLPL